MSQSLFRADRNSWKEDCGHWALELARGTSITVLLLVGLISILPIFEAARDASHLEHDGTFLANRCFVQNLQESPDHNAIWVSRHCRNTEKVDVTTGIRSEELLLPSGYLSGMQLNPAGNRIIFVGSDGKLTVGRRDHQDWELMPVCPKPGDIEQFALCPVADLLAIATVDSVEVWSFKKTPLPLGIIPRSGGVSKMEWSPDGCQVLILNNDGVLEIRHGETLAVVQCAKTSIVGHGCCFWSPDGRSVAATGKSGTLAIWKLEETRDSLRHIKCPSHLTAAFSHDGCWLAMPDMRGRLWLINAIDPDDRYELGELSADPCAVRFASDDSCILVGFTDGSLECWSVSDRQLAWVSSDADSQDL